MWETQLQFTYSDYALDCERKEVLLEQVKLLYSNLKPEALMEMRAIGSCLFLVHINV